MQTSTRSTSRSSPRPITIRWSPRSSITSRGARRARGTLLPYARENEFAQALGRWRPPAGRGRREVLVLDAASDQRFTLIDDAFNANPASLAAALDVLAATLPGPGGRRIAILGDMLELGDTERALHRAIADHPALASTDVVHCVGPRMDDLWHDLPQDKRGKCVPRAEDLVGKAHLLVHAGDVVLVKGSKGSYVSRVVDALRHLGLPPGDDLTGE